MSHAVPTAIHCLIHRSHLLEGELATLSVNQTHLDFRTRWKVRVVNAERQANVVRVRPSLAHGSAAGAGQGMILAIEADPPEIKVRFRLRLVAGGGVARITDFALLRRQRRSPVRQQHCHVWVVLLDQGTHAQVLVPHHRGVIHAFCGSTPIGVFPKDQLRAGLGPLVVTVFDEFIAFALVDDAAVISHSKPANLLPGLFSHDGGSAPRIARILRQEHAADGILRGVLLMVLLIHPIRGDDLLGLDAIVIDRLVRKGPLALDLPNERLIDLILGEEGPYVFLDSRLRGTGLSHREVAFPSLLDLLRLHAGRRARQHEQRQTDERSARVCLQHPCSPSWTDTAPAGTRTWGSSLLTSCFGSSLVRNAAWPLGDVISDVVYTFKSKTVE